MPSEIEIAANRSTSKRNTVPRVRGKLGLFSRAVVLPGESKSELLALHRSLRAEHRPEGQTHELLVDHVVACVWQLRRVLARIHKPPCEHGRKEAETDSVPPLTKEEAEISMHRALRELRLWLAAGLRGRGKKKTAGELVKVDVITGGHADRIGRAQGEGVRFSGAICHAELDSASPTQARDPESSSG